jgi:F0F1-type ATP synthase epsilon subunit
MTLEIFSDIEIITKDKVYSIGLNSISGSITILNNHIPISTIVKNKIVVKSDVEDIYEINEGFFTFYNNNARIICNRLKRIQ